MTIQTYPKNFANFNVPEPPRGAILVNLADVEKLLAAYRKSHLNCHIGVSTYDWRCPACKEYDSINALARAAEENL
jgi:hypothetical protein